MSREAPRWFGAPLRRKEDPRLITGSSMYVDDLKLPGMVSVAFVRSPYAHAGINGIDGTAALAVPGVHAVFAADDLKKVFKSYYQEVTSGESTVSANSRTLFSIRSPW